MRTRHQKLQPGWTVRYITAVVTLAICAASAQSQQQRTASVSVQVLDQQGAVIVGAQAKLTDPAGHEHVGKTNDEGKVVLSDLALGKYSFRITAEHFKAYEDPDFQVRSIQEFNIHVTLNIAGVEENVAVFADTSIAQVAEYVGGSLVIRGDALVALDGPGGLEAFLRALALRTSGPFGPVALVNGFEDGQVPPTYSIREIRINDNPYSAEYASLGLGRIEILTKPGSEKLHGSAFGILGDANLNSRNPFALDRVLYQSRMYGGNVSGPISRKRAAYFVDFNKQHVNSNAVINATIVNSSSMIVPLRQAVVTPQLRTSVSPRLDYQMGTNHTWVARYAETRSHADNSGVGEFSLLSRAQNSDGRTQTYQLTETAVLNSRAINEIRAQYVRTTSSRFGDNSVPTINVPGAFLGGGADISTAYSRQRLVEVQNVTSWQSEKHIVKAGLQGRYTTQLDGSTQNFGGIYTFSSRIAPQLDSLNEVVTDANGTAVMIPIETIEAYRRTLLFRAQGLSPDKIRELGGGASQFAIARGDIESSARQYQAGAFIQDNWRLHPNFTLSGGIRYERQNNVSRRAELAPRMSFAWAIGGNQKTPATVLRGGVGIFYDRIADNVVLRARELDGQHQRQYFTSDNSILDVFPAGPTPSLLDRFAGPQSTVRLASDLRVPYTVNSSLAVERQLFRGLTVAVTASSLRSFHLMRSRNVNSPIQGGRPFPNAADIFQYESSGKFDQRQLLLNMVYRAGKDVTLWSTYTLSNSKTDTESPDTFPANSYDLRGEFSRSAGQARHTFYWGGWIRTKGGIEITPLVLWRSQVPFNITTGRDSNGDALFTDRPAFATDLTRTSVVATPFGKFDLDPLPGQQIIPRNYGESAKFFIANLRLGKRIALTKTTGMTVSVQGTNIFNHTNEGAPVGTLLSPLFGRSNVSAGDWGLGSNQAGNRRLEVMLFFAF
jgi:hypothetical protein